MEDALFNVLLFTAFYCLYSKMFAPKTQPTPVVAAAAVQQPTTQTVQTTTTEAHVTPVAKSIAPDIATPVAAATTDSTLSVESAHHLEPDREPIGLTSDFAIDAIDQGGTDTKTVVGFTSTATPTSSAKQGTSTRTTTKSRQTKQPAIARGKGSESHH